jgi:acetyl esterase/lipase
MIRLLLLLAVCRAFLPPHLLGLRKSSATAPLKVLLLATRIDEEEMTTLPLVPDPGANPGDDWFRWTRNNWPRSFINYLRDSGAGRSIQDGLVVIGLPALIKEYPELLQSFLALSNVLPSSTTKLKTESYGPHPLQIVDIFDAKSSSEGNNSNDLVLFCHGGAWNSGKPWMYRAVAAPFLENNQTVAIWGYRTYPDADVSGQIQDLLDCLDHLKSGRDWSSITIVGHSSGAHIATLAALQREHLCDYLIGVSPVCDIPNHYDWESSRGVEEISALKPACGYTLENWIANSPTRVVEDARPHSMPSLLYVHGDVDITVPYTSALNLTNAFKKWGIDCDFELLPNVGHVETVMHFMLGGETKDFVIDWMNKRRQ